MGPSQPDSAPEVARRPARDLIDAILHNMRENLELLRYSTLKLLPRCGHLAPLEQSGAFSRLAIEFLSA